MRSEYTPGDWVIYRATRHGKRPSPKAQRVFPASKGELYTYIVEKLRRVVEIGDDGSLVLEARSGKRRVVAGDDPNVRRTSWWERIKYRRYIRAIRAVQSESDEFWQR